MFPYVVLIVLSAFAQTFHLGLASPVTPASNDHGLIQKPWSNDTSLSTTPHALVIPPDPSVYRFPGTDLYITFRDFGDPLNKRDALGVLYVKSHTVLSMTSTTPPHRLCPHRVPFLSLSPTWLSFHSHPQLINKQQRPPAPKPAPTSPF